MPHEKRVIAGRSQGQIEDPDIRDILGTGLMGASGTVDETGDAGIRRPGNGTSILDGAEDSE
jgi:hypothetical protein